MSARVLITGATGFAGRHLVAACEAAGDAVVAAPRSSAADLRDPAVARSLVAEARPGVVYHLAARAHVGLSWEDPLGTFADNVAMTANLLDAVRHEAPDATVISIGSGEEYGPPETVPTTEDAPLRPQNPYAVSKASSGLVARFYADAYGLRVIHARAFNHAGPGQEPIYAIANFARQVAAGTGRVVSGSPDTRRDITDVRDVVRAYALMAAHARTQRPYNVCRGTAYRIRDLLDLLLAQASVTIAVETDPSRLRPSDNPIVLGSHARLTAETGWTPEIPIERTLADILDYWRGRRAAA
jgi:GDP-4-dehydro-6-deoxy-D-mannose reductase